MDVPTPSIQRPGITLCRAAVVLMMLGGLFAGCDPSGDGECDPACNSGEVCNRVSGECVPVRLTRFEGDVPGRNLSMASNGDRIYLGTLDPQNGYLLVGTLADATPRMYILRQFQTVRDKSLAMATNGEMVVVAWLDDDDRYRFATHRHDGEADRWRSIPLEGATGLDYSGTSDFDVAIDGSNTLHLVFRDAQRLLPRQIWVDERDRWSIHTIDNRTESTAAGDDSALHQSCPDGADAQTNAGLGYDPDVLVRGSDVLAAYHDRDCGDLRLARRVEDGWAAVAIDQGKLTASSTAETGITGRYPSIAFDADGRLALAYHDVTRSRLVFAFQRNGEFQIEEVDEGAVVEAFSRRKHLVGPFASLTFDSEERPWIAYMDATTTSIKLAHRDAPLDDAGSWEVISVTELEAPTGFFIDLEDGVIGAESLRPTENGFDSRLDIHDVEEL